MNASRYLLFAILATNFILVSCSQGVPNNTTASSSSSSAISTQSSSGYTTKTETLSSSDGVTVKKITVSSRCIGCGKCARIDPTHFTISNHRAQAIQTSGNDSALERAIDNCPVSAISAA